MPSLGDISITMFYTHLPLLSMHGMVGLVNAGVCNVSAILRQTSPLQQAAVLQFFIGSTRLPCLSAVLLGNRGRAYGAKPDCQVKAIFNHAGSGREALPCCSQKRCSICHTSCGRTLQCGHIALVACTCHP